jgi:hypothetical protein
VELLRSKFEEWDVCVRLRRQCFRDALGYGEKGGLIVCCATFSSFSLDEFSWGLML